MFVRQLQKGQGYMKLHKKKSATMAWCLFEALREEERQFLAEASCMSLAQDSRAGRLLTRWVACGGSDRELVVRSGVLQLHRGQVAGAVALHQATWKGLLAFATRRRRGNMTMLEPRQAERVDKKLCAHLAAITEVFVADGAADEQMAGHLLRPSWSEGLAADHQRLVRTLPNLQLVVMDRAHASRRVLQRTWDKDEYLNSILKPIIWDKQSLVRVLQNSIAKEFFRDLQLDEEADGGVHMPVSNMNYAKQRFDSCEKPLARLINHFKLQPSWCADAQPMTLRPAEPVGRCGSWTLRPFFSSACSQTVQRSPFG